MDEPMTGAAGGVPDDLAGRLGTALRELVPDRAVTPGLVDRVQQGVDRRRRNRRDLLAGTSVLVCALAVVTGLVTLLPTRGQQFSVTVLSSSSPPAPAGTGSDGIDRTRPYQRVLPAELPPEGGEVALVLVNPTGRSAVAGLQGRIDRWDGAAWRPYRQYSAAAPEWGWAGRVADLGRPPGARDLAVVAPAHGYADPTWLRLPPLPEGRYRFVDGAGPDAGPDAGPAGVLVVRAGAATADGIRPDRSPFLVVDPMPGSRQARLVLHRTQGATVSGSLRTAPGLRRVTWSTRIALDRRTAGGGWDRTGYLGLRSDQLRPLLTGEPATITGLSFAPGTYRLTLAEIGPADGLTGYTESGVLFVLPEP